MAQAIRFHETGGPEVLRLEQVEVGEPGPGQARVRHAYVAVNFIDVYFRTGRYPMPLPNGLGSDAVVVGKERQRDRRVGATVERHRQPLVCREVGADALGELVSVGVRHAGEGIPSAP